MKQDKQYEELIEKHAEREMRIREQSENFKKEIEDEQLPKKQITVKLFPNTHKALKIRAAAQGTTLEKVATAIIENQVSVVDIVEFVEFSFKDASEFEEKGIDVYETTAYAWLHKMDNDNRTYDINDKLLKKGNPRKRINVKVSPEAHRKLRVISAIQDRSLDNLVSSIIEHDIGENVEINSNELMDEIVMRVMNS